MRGGDERARASERRGRPSDASSRLPGTRRGVAVPPPDPSIWSVNPNNLESVRERLIPHPLASLEQPIRLKGDHRNPRRTYVWARGGTSKRFYEKCRRKSGRTTIALDGGHNLMVDSPGAVANILVEAAS